jgi:hypothetical protein
MGLFDDILSPNTEEEKRYKSLLKQKRSQYPQIINNSNVINAWFKKGDRKKIKERTDFCKDLDKDIRVLRVEVGGFAEDSVLSDGFRVDERYAKVYKTIYDEYMQVFRTRKCQTVLDIDNELVDTDVLADKVKETQTRIEQDTQKQRTIIIAVGGAVLLLGTVIILRKL